MKLLDLQDMLDPVTGLQIRIEVLDQVIADTLGYIEHRPEYADWYNFSVEHLRHVRNAYQNQIDKMQGAPNGTEVH